MRKLITAIAICLGLTSSALAQTTFTMPPPAGVALMGLQSVTSCGSAALSNNGLAYATMDLTGKLCTAASVSASITGFNPTTTGTPIAVTTGGVTGTLPAGAVVVASNVGTTNTAYCKLGASAATSDQPIAPNGGWFAFTVSAATQLTCITSTSTTTVNMVGGSGLPTGTGGGGGGSSSSITSWAGGTLGAMANYGTSPGAVLVPGMNAFVTNSPAVTNAGTFATQVNGFTSWAGSTLGAMANYGTSPGAVLVPGVNAFITNANSNGQATMANSSPTVLASNQSVADPCMFQAKSNLAIATNATSLTQVLAASGSTTVYICSLSLIAGGATTFTLSGGTGTNCATTNTVIIGATPVANSLSFAANGGLTLGNGGGTIAKSSSSQELCAINGSGQYVSGNLTYVQQ